MQTEVLFIKEPRPYFDGGCSGCALTVFTPFFILCIKYKTVVPGIILGLAITWCLVFLVPHAFRNYRELSQWRRRTNGNQTRIELSDTHLSSYSFDGTLEGHYALTEIADLAMFQGFDKQHGYFDERVIRFNDNQEMSFFVTWTERLNRKRFLRILRQRSGKTFQYRKNLTRNRPSSAS